MSHTKLILAIVFIAFFSTSKAQDDCGVFPDFYWQVNPNNVPVFYDSTSVGEGWEITGYSWNFGDGGTSTQENPSHPYSQPGNYTVCLLVEAYNAALGESCYEETCWQYVHCGTLSGSFTYQVNGDAITFIASGSAQYGPPAYIWTFGDGSQVMDGQVVEHIFSAPGVYQVCLTIFDANNCTYNVCQSIVISSPSCVGVEASFEYTAVGDQILTESNSASNGLPLQYQWTLNGQEIFGFDVSAQWINLQAGTYVVCLTVGAMGSVCDTYCETIAVEGNPLCAGFDVDIVEDVNEVGQVVWTAVSIGGTQPYIYEWLNGETTQQIIVTDSVWENCVQVYDSNQCLAIHCDTLGTIDGCNLNLNLSYETNGAVTTIDIAPYGGVPPYSYFMNNGSLNGTSVLVEVPGNYCFTVVDAEGCYATDCYTLWDTSNHDTICGYVFNDINGNGIFNDNEIGIPNSMVHLNSYSVITDGQGYWQAIVPPDFYYIYYCMDEGNLITVPLDFSIDTTNLNCTGYYNVLSSENQGSCNYNFGVQLVAMSICGKVFYDTNHNGVLDQNEEFGVNAAQVLLTTSSGQTYLTYSDYLGNYCISVPEGEYTIEIYSGVYETCDLQPIEILVNGVQGEIYNNQNFAIQCTQGSCNLSVDVIPQTTVTPGFPAWYSVYVCNEGGTVASGTANYFYDNSALTFNYSTPSPTLHDAATGHITWNIDNLLPGQCSSFWLNFTSPTNTQLGNSVLTLVNIDSSCNDLNLSNNVDSLHQTVVGSWDPNNKLAYKTNHDSNVAYQWISSINNDQRIEYVINFQNTGSAPAVNVVIEDFISEDLDMSTFEVLGASHPMYTIINGNEVNFRFPNIYLADSTNNEPESHGHVRFAINAHNGLSAGHIISDDAAIYFDFNEPVITNESQVEMLNVVGVDKIQNAQSVLAYPNPMDQQVQFKNLSGNPFRVRILDTTGRTILEKSSLSNAIQVDRSNLASGMYFYEVIELNSVIANGKLVVR